MKTEKFLITPIMAIMLLSLSACDLNLKPYEAVLYGGIGSSVEELTIFTNGSYSCIKHREYNRHAHFFGELGGDNVSFNGITADHILQTYRYTHLQQQNDTYEFWSSAYRAIYATNTVIERIERLPNRTSAHNQLLAENKFLRAMAHFDLVKYFGRPYAQITAGDHRNLGVPIVTTTDFNITSSLSRNTVLEVHDFIVKELLEAAELFIQEKNSCFASKEVCYALLSRIYLYMEDNERAIEYADKVINSGRYTMFPSAQLPDYYTLVPENNPETIFAVRFTVADNLDRSSIGSMYYTAQGTNTGWAEINISFDFFDLIYTYPEDIRNGFIEIVYRPYSSSLNRYYSKKYNWQEGVVNLSSPVVLRLAEMYLNRAEANAKLENYEYAIEDVNLIRTRAGLSGSALYSVDDLKEHSTVLEVVLEERRLELFLESHRKLDLFRNHLPLVRAYPGYHSNDLFHQRVEPTSSSIVHFIPELERNINKNLVNNPHYGM